MSLPSVLKEIDSVYSINGYEHIFYSTVKMLKPKTIVEFGVFGGYTLLSMAAAMESGALTYGYDLFEEFPYHHCPLAIAEANLAKSGLGDRVFLFQKDAWTVPPFSIDLLHIDLSNDGDTCRKAFDVWGKYVSQAILIEGGTEQRDQAWWMKKFNRPSIRKAIEEIGPEWDVSIIQPWPSMAIAVRK